MVLEIPLNVILLRNMMLYCTDQEEQPYLENHTSSYQDGQGTDMLYPANLQELQGYLDSLSLEEMRGVRGEKV